MSADLPAHACAVSNAWVPQRMSNEVLLSVELLSDDQLLDDQRLDDQRLDDQLSEDQSFK